MADDALQQTQRLRNLITADRMTGNPLQPKRRQRNLNVVVAQALFGCLAGLILALAGCTTLKAPPSLGDWMRGNHKPITPDESSDFPAPTQSSVSSSLQSSEVYLDGSAPPDLPSGVDDIAIQAQANGRHVSRQFPEQPADGYGGYGANGRNTIVTPPNTNTVPATPTQLSPGYGQPGPSYGQPVQGFGQPVQNYGQPAPAFGQPAQVGPPRTQANPYAFQPGTNEVLPSTEPVVTLPPTATQSIAPPTFGGLNAGPTTPTYVPGNGVDFPPIGTDPVYTPTLRYADLIINGFPARTGRIMLGGAVNSDAGVTGQITIDERNFDITRWPASFTRLFTGQPALRGAGETFRLEAAPGSDFDRYTVQWATPNLFNYLPFSFSISGFLFDRRFNDWDEQRLGGRMSLGYRITPDLSVSLGISGQEVEITNPSSLLSPTLNDALGENEYYNGSVSLKHDTRNSPIQASRGHYFEFSFEKAFGDFDYARFELEFRQYWLLTERIDGSGKQTISYSTQVGFSGDDTPIFENFFAGGYATIRGFDFRGASPLENGVEVGGQFQWLNSVEYMFPVTADDAFRGVLFVDFGTVEQSVDINADNFRVAPGAGIRVAIPAMGPAPLAFDFAFPVASAATDDERIFSFYMSLIR